MCVKRWQMEKIFCAKATGVGNTTQSLVCETGGLASLGAGLVRERATLSWEGGSGGSKEEAWSTTGIEVSLKASLWKDCERRTPKKCKKYKVNGLNHMWRSVYVAWAEENQSGESILRINRGYVSHKGWTVEIARLKVSQTQSYHTRKQEGWFRLKYFQDSCGAWEAKWTITWNTIYSHDTAWYVLSNICLGSSVRRGRGSTLQGRLGVKSSQFILEGKINHRF